MRRSTGGLGGATFVPLVCALAHPGRADADLRVASPSCSSRHGGSPCLSPGLVLVAGRGPAVFALTCDAASARVGRAGHLRAAGRRRRWSIRSVRRPPPSGPATGASTTGRRRASRRGASADGVVVFAGRRRRARCTSRSRHADGLRTSYSFLDVDRASCVGPARAPGRSDRHRVGPVPLRGARSRWQLPRPGPAVRRRAAPAAAPGPGRRRRRAATGARAPSSAQSLRAHRPRPAGRGGGVRRPGGRRARRRPSGCGVQSVAGPDLGRPTRRSIARDLEVWYLAPGPLHAGERRPCRHPAGRRILVEVGGIGSTSEAAAVDRVDRAALGYAPGDVLRFSYGGGRTPGWLPAGSPLGRPPGHRVHRGRHRARPRPVGRPAATSCSREVAAAEPGRAHRRGRPQPGRGRQPAGPRADPAAAAARRCSTLVTLATPHHGSNLATALAVGPGRPRPRRAPSTRAYATGWSAARSERRRRSPAGRDVSGDRPHEPLSPSPRACAWCRSAPAATSRSRPPARSSTAPATAPWSRRAALHAHDDLPGSAAATPGDRPGDRRSAADVSTVRRRPRATR